nr:AraC family transcriptional regulator [uncultured Sediminibacterium sp.]
MYLFPGSQLMAGLRNPAKIPERLRSFLIEGFDSSYLEGNGYAQLCQHYDHGEADIYQYHVFTSKPVQLFSKSETVRWVMGYWPKGGMRASFYEKDNLDVQPHTVFFFQTQPGKEIRFTIPGGQFQICCCCFKVGFESILQTFYPVVLSSEIQYPIILDNISFRFQYAWEMMLPSKHNQKLLSGYYAAQIRVLLDVFSELYLERKGSNGYDQLHPDVDPAIVHKAYLVKKVIEERYGDQLGLAALSKAVGWNLQGLKSGFLKVFGLSPHQYIIQYRMRVAYELIQQSETLNIQAIALQCGYKQPHHFIKQFKGIYGKTPGEVRRGGA